MDADEAISLRLKAREEAGDPYARRDRERLMEEFHRIRDRMVEDGPPIFIEPAPRLTRSIYSNACKAAKSR